MVSDHSRDTNSTGLGQCLQARRNIDAVAEDVVAINDHVSQIDPDAEPDPALFGHVLFTADHRALDLNSASHGIDNARELGQQAVAGVLHNPAAVLPDLRINQLAEMCLQAFVRTLLVGAHKPRITGHVGGKDGGETAGRGHGGGRPLWSKVRSR